MEEYLVYIYIDDGEVKCSASTRICDTCEYREAFECKLAVARPMEVENE